MPTLNRVLQTTDSASNYFTCEIVWCDRHPLFFLALVLARVSHWSTVIVIHIFCVDSSWVHMCENCLVWFTTTMSFLAIRDFLALCVHFWKLGIPWSSALLLSVAHHQIWKSGNNLVVAPSCDACEKILCFHICEFKLLFYVKIVIMVRSVWFHVSDIND